MWPDAMSILSLRALESNTDVSPDIVPPDLVYALDTNGELPPPRSLWKLLPLPATLRPN